MLRASKRIAVKLLTSSLGRCLSQLNRMVRPVPGIALDIDGVLRKGNFPVQNASKTIRLLKTPLADISPKFAGIQANIPFVLMTNGGGNLERAKAEELNKILGIKEDWMKLREDDMLLCHTPLRELAADYKDKYVIAAGLGNILDISLEYGFNKVITIDEYSALFPFLSRLSILG